MEKDANDRVLAKHLAGVEQTTLAQRHLQKVEGAVARIHATAADAIKRRLAERAEVHKAEHDARVKLAADRDFQLQRLRAETELKKAELSAGKRRAQIVVRPQSQSRTITPRTIRPTRTQSPSVLGSFKFVSQPSGRVDYWGKGVRLAKPSLALSFGNQTGSVSTKQPVVNRPKKKRAYW